MDMRGKSLGMSYDCIRNEYKCYIDFPENEPYYNSGVVLIDMEKWRELHNMEKIMYHIKNVRSKYPLVDQDFINCALKDQIVPIGVKYNFLSQLFLYNYEGIKKVYHLDEKYWCSRDEFEAGKAQAVIYHFAGQTFLRPWYRNSHHPMKKLYDRYYAMSPWGDVSQEKAKWRYMYLIQYMIYRICSPKIATYLGEAMQGVFMRRGYGIKSTRRKK